MGLEGREFDDGDDAAAARDRAGGAELGERSLAAERVVAVLGDSVVSEPAGEIELKGMARPVAIHRVTSLA